MTITPVPPFSSLFGQVKALYYSAFPENERLPFSRMALVSLLHPSVKLYAFHDQEVFCGFSFTVSTDRYLYISYIAVNPQLRSSGYGTKMLAALQERFPQPILCEVKRPVPNQPDYQQSLRRITFWKRNGLDFFDNQYVITNPHGVKYLICAAAPYDREAYLAIFDHLSLGPGAALRLLKKRS